MRLKFLLLLLLAGLAAVSCSEKELIDQVPKNERAIREDVLESHKKDKDYQYNREIEVTRNPFLKAITYIFEAVFGFFGTVGGYILIILVVVLVAYLIFKMNRPQPAYDPLTESGVGGLINSSDEIDLASESEASLEEKIQNALGTGNFREAIRYSFLLLLYDLNQRKTIKYHIKKTNSEYRYELPADKHGVYSSLCRIYDFVWYGNYPSSEGTWKSFQTLISQFEDK